MDSISLPFPSGGYLELPDNIKLERRQRILEQAQDGREFWVFGFGSLMWNPCYDFDAKSEAVVSGYDRKFHIWTSVARGTSERPGLGLCLELSPGVDCQGMAWRLKPENRERDLDALWEREMTTGVYKAIWLEAIFKGGKKVMVMTFVVDRAHRQYAGKLPLDMMAEIIAGAAGKYGTNVDYLANTITEMKKLGVQDDELDDLLGRVRKLEAKGQDPLITSILRG